MKRCRYRPTKRGVFAVLVIVLMLLLAGWIEKGMADDNKTIIIPSTNSDSSSSTIIYDQGGKGSTMVHCITGESGLTYCIEL